MTDIKMPTIAVIIPAYNAAPYIARAIASILAQTLPAAEIIVVDDGSTDGTRSVVAGFGDQVHYIYKTNGGTASAKNIGIKAARSEFICFQDADDESLPRKLAILAEAISACPQAALATGACLTTYDGRTRRVPPAGWILEGKSGPNIVADFFDKYAQEYWLHTNTVIIRRKVFEELGGFREELATAEDLEMWCRIAGKYPCAFIDEDVATYQMDTPGSLLKTQRAPAAFLYSDEEIILRIRPEAREGYREFRDVHAKLLARRFLLIGRCADAQRALELVGPGQRDFKTKLLSLLARTPSPIAGSLARGIFNIKAFIRQMCLCTARRNTPRSQRCAGREETM